ncbi:MAG: hypothetical protein MK008_10765 [Bdellovibrionales bacterium]|nr:hypothetical protein [Bdellovibrionales bacterium]
MKKLILILYLFTLIGCAGGGTTVGSPVTIELKLSSYSTALSLRPQAVSSLTFCFKRLRFKKEGESTNGDTSSDEDNIDLNLGEVIISPSGTDLTSVTIPAGEYSRVEFDLEKDCLSQKSLQVTNSNGSFSTEDRITIKFEGYFIAASSSQTLSLGVSNIISKLDEVTADSEIKAKAEAASGTL